jgi:hypothetical protein
MAERSWAEIEVAAVGVAGDGGGGWRLRRLRRWSEMEEVAWGWRRVRRQDGGVDLRESRSNDSRETKEVALTGCAKITL